MMSTVISVIPCTIPRQRSRDELHRLTQSVAAAEADAFRLTLSAADTAQALQQEGARCEGLRDAVNRAAHDMHRCVRVHVQPMSSSCPFHIKPFLVHCLPLFGALRKIGVS